MRLRRPRAGLQRPYRRLDDRVLLALDSRSGRAVGDGDVRLHAASLEGLAVQALDRALREPEHRAVGESLEGRAAARHSRGRLADDRTDRVRAELESER